MIWRRPFVRHGGFGDTPEQVIDSTVEVVKESLLLRPGVCIEQHRRRALLSLDGKERHADRLQ